MVSWAVVYLLIQCSTHCLLNLWWRRGAGNGPLYLPFLAKSNYLIISHIVDFPRSLVVFLCTAACLGSIFKSRAAISLWCNANNTVNEHEYIFSLYNVIIYLYSDNKLWQIRSGFCMCSYAYSIWRLPDRSISRRSPFKLRWLVLAPSLSFASIGSLVCVMHVAVLVLGVLYAQLGFSVFLAVIVGNSWNRLRKAYHWEQHGCEGTTKGNDISVSVFPTSKKGYSVIPPLSLWLLFTVFRNRFTPGEYRVLWLEISRDR